MTWHAAPRRIAEPEVDAAPRSSADFYIEADAVLATYNSDDLQQTNVRSVPLEFQVLLPGRTRLVWDTYLQRKLNPALASNGGVVHPENALKVRSRISAVASF
jgi:hypothetical protein